MLKRKNFSLTLYLLFIIVFQGAVSENIFAQNRQPGVIEGRILSADGQPEENVIVVLIPSERQTQSDDNGYFEFRNIPYGTYTIAVKSLGVSAKPVSIEVDAQKVSVGDIQLKENASTLDRVIVSSSYRHINKNSTQVARIPLTYTENPQNYAVVPKELLHTQLVTTTEQALLNIPGVSNMSVVGGSGGSSLTFKSRGFANGSVIYRNGVSTGYVALTDLFNLERFEAIKGPSATLFGGNQGASYGGVYNIITKQPLEVKRGEVSFTTGSYELARTTVDYNTPLNDDKTALIRVNGMYDSRNSFQQLAQNSVGFAPALLIKANDRLTLNFEGYYYKSTRPIVLFGFSAPPGATTSSSSYAGNVADLHLDPKNPYFLSDFNSSQQTWAVTGKAEYKLSDKWLSQTNYSLARNNNVTYYLNFTANKASATDTTVITRNLLYMPHSQLYTQQFQQNFIGDFKIGAMRNRLLVGVDYFRTNVGSARGSFKYDDIKTTATSVQQLLIKKARVDSLASRTNFTVGGRDIANSYGAYISEVLNITDRLLLMASLRINRFESVTGDYKQTSYSPKLGASYQIIPGALSVYANYNNGYNNVSGLDSLGNLLKPEYADQLEGGLKLDVLQHRLAATVSVYDINVKNRARAVSNYYVQDNEQRSRGVDIDILANPVAGLNIAVGYGYNDIRYSVYNGVPVKVNGQDIEIEGKRVESSPYHAGNIWGTYQFTSGGLKGFGLGFGGNGQSSSFTNHTNTITLNGFFVTGASVFYNALKFRIGAKIDNIGNKKYYTYNSWLFAGQPRMLSFNITYRF